MPRVCVSGGFDNLHAGHVRLFEAAAQHGDLIVILNSDDWLVRKKGWRWMNWEDRAAVLHGCKFVSDVVPVDDVDETVCEALRRIKPDYFGKSADRTRETTPEVELCTELGIKLLFDLVPNWQSSGTKMGSSDIVKRGWGEYEVLDVTGNTKVKRVRIMPGQSISRQYHNHRSEHWFVESGTGWVVLEPAPSRVVQRYKLLPGASVTVEPRTVHKLWADHGSILQVIEVQTGERCDEDDIVRLDAVEHGFVHWFKQEDVPVIKREE